MKGIMFRPEMIPTIVNGTKTQTRRVMQNQPVEMDKVYYKDFRKDAGGRKSRYQVGEVVYIKEAICIECYGESIPCFKEEHNEDCDSAHWISPLFCPSGLARYFIQITGVRAERLQKITEEDALAEGIQIMQGTWQAFKIDSETGKPTLVGEPQPYTARYHYEALWDSINPKQKWDTNPFVWVYSFIKVDKPT